MTPTRHCASSHVLASFACDASRQTRLFNSDPGRLAGPSSNQTKHHPHNHLRSRPPPRLSAEADPVQSRRLLPFGLWRLPSTTIPDYFSPPITPRRVLRAPRHIPLQHHQLLGLAKGRFGETRSSRCRQVAWKSRDSPHLRPPPTLRFTMTTFPTRHPRRENESDHSEPTASDLPKAERKTHNPQKGKSSRKRHPFQPPSLNPSQHLHRPRSLKRSRQNGDPSCHISSRPLRAQGHQAHLRLHILPSEC